MPLPAGLGGWFHLIWPLGLMRLDRVGVGVYLTLNPKPSTIRAETGRSHLVPVNSCETGGGKNLNPKP